MNQSLPEISVVICTRNRKDSVVATLVTILANTHPHFEIILIDQSTNLDTEQSVARFHTDSRFRYFHSHTIGLGRARNIGIGLAQSEIVALTDDDCTVPANWLEVIAGIFEKHQRVSVVFCNVDPGPHDQSRGFIPAYRRQDSKLIRTMWGKCRARGIGAGIAVRRQAVFAFGGFDESLGAGAFFSSCEDGDIAVRALINGQWVYETHEVAVIHHGFRTWQEGKDLTQRDWVGIGAAYAKPLKCGHWNITIIICHEALVVGLWNPLSSILRLKKPQGFKRFYYFSRGFIKGMKTPVDCQHIKYKLQ
jgi:glycosyltransferase involved in cell wall biosynthesis